MGRRDFKDSWDNCGGIEALWDRLMDRFDALEKKIDRLTKQKNCLNGDELLDNQDLCLLLKTSKRSLQRYRDKRVLPFHMIEGKVCYKSSDIHEFIRNSYKPATRKPPPNEPL